MISTSGLKFEKFETNHGYEFTRFHDLGGFLTDIVLRLDRLAEQVTGAEMGKPVLLNYLVTLGPLSAPWSSF